MYGILDGIALSFQDVKQMLTQMQEGGNSWVRNEAPMREILYRALSMCRGEHWVYGQPRHYARDPHTEKWTIYDPKTGIETDIDEETLCQYTGVVDRNGKQVFENDIIGYTDTDTGKTKIFGVVKWYHEGNFYINTDTYYNYTSDNDCANVGYMLNRATTKLIVHGNIHDNPELLKGDEK